MIFVYLLMLCVVMGRSSNGDSPFDNNYLPLQRTYQLTNTQLYQIPVHFGLPGTTIYENFIVVHPSTAPAAQIGIFDCFCAGDNFIMHLTDTYTGQTMVYGPAANFSPLDCSNYSETMETCLQDGNFSKVMTVLPKANKLTVYNVTFEVTLSAYGGGIAYFMFEPLPTK